MDRLTYGVEYIEELIRQQPDLSEYDAVLYHTMETVLRDGHMLGENEMLLRFLYDNRSSFPLCAQFYQNQMYNLPITYLRLHTCPQRPELYRLFFELVVVNTRTYGTAYTAQMVARIISDRSFLTLAAQASTNCDRFVAAIVQILRTLNIELGDLSATDGSTLFSIAVTLSWRAVLNSLLKGHNRIVSLLGDEQPWVYPNPKPPVVVSRVVHAFTRNTLLFSEFECKLPPTLNAMVAAHLAKH